MIVAFVVREARAANPLIPLRIFRSRNVSGANAIQALSVAGMFGMFFLGALYMLSVVLTYVTDRYRLPMAVFLIPFAAGALARLTPAALPELRRDALNPLALCLAAPILLLCNITLLRRTAYDESQGWVNLAQVYYDRADYENALDSFYQAVRAEPERMAEAAFLCGGAAAEKTGRTNEAFTIFRAGLEVHPDAALLRERRDRLLRSSTR